MEQIVLQKIVISGNPPENKRCLWVKGNKFYFWNKGAWRSTEDDSAVELNERLDSLEKKVNTVSKLENKVNTIQKQLKDLLE